MFSLSSWQFWLCVIIVILVIFSLLFGQKGKYDYTPLEELLPEYQGVINTRINNVRESSRSSRNIRIPPNKNRGVSEQLVAEEFTKIIMEYGGNPRNITYNKRHQFLINPETGRRLELDMFYNDGHIKIAVEYNGEHHTKFPNRYHSNTELGKREFDALQRRDQYKKQMCEQNNIVLISMPPCDVCDLNNNNEYVYVPRIRTEERRERIRSYLVPKINYCILNYND